MRSPGQPLLRHAIANGIKLLTSFAVGLILPPLIIQFIGLETYGLWAFACALVQAVFIVECGFPAALSKYIAEFDAKSEHHKISALMTVCLVVYVAIGCVLAVAFLLGGQWLMAVVFRGHPDRLHMLGVLVLLMVFLTLLSLLGSLFTAVINGLQRMDVSGYIGAAGVGVNGVLSVVLLVLHMGIWALPVAFGLSTGLTLVMAYAYVRRRAPSVSLDLTLLRSPSTWESLRKLLALSASDAVARMSAALIGPGIRLLLGAFAGVTATAYYDLASRPIAQLTTVPLLVSTPLVPAVAALQTRAASTTAAELVCKSLKYLNLLALPLFAFSVTFAKPLVGIWLGPGYDPVARTIQILALGTYVNLLTAPAYHALLGAGKPRLGVHLGLINLTANAFLTVLLIGKYGLLGAATGQAAALCAASLYFLNRFHREQTLPAVRIHWETSGKPGLAVAAISVVFLLLYRATGEIFPVSNGLFMVGLSAGYALTFLSVLRYYRILNDRDLEVVTHFLRRR